MFLFWEGEAPNSVAAGFVSGKWTLIQIRRRRFFLRGVKAPLVLCRRLYSPKWRQSVEEKSWSRWRLFGVSDLEACGGGAPVTSRDGGGQVEAEETRVVLMGSYPSTRPAYLMRGPTEVGRVWFGPQAC
ncbi:hypothetical protein F2Q68_00024597 [Brassica cretica]|uniref:Uncharacterized protein n=1 Tax=Brassica cretica TaxID=69181 RepID=A0A8S9IDH3_BRACR|nr:hypothetical protein F2Q68_00024597 [Brassica cretica]